jgi:hypothetical protein
MKEVPFDIPFHNPMTGEWQPVCLALPLDLAALPRISAHFRTESRIFGEFQFISPACVLLRRGKFT